jgi:hypothetical protein
MKYYRLLVEPSTLKVKTPLSLALNLKTGFYTNDYIRLVTEEGEIVDVISDESCLKNYSCISLVFLSIVKTKQTKIEKLLEDLVKKYKIESIHFVEIFGKKRILGQNKIAFLDEYATIVSQVPMLAVAFSRDKETLTNELRQEELTQEEIYFNLFWNGFALGLPAFQDHTIFHIHYEADFLPEAISDKLANKLINKHETGIIQFIEKQNKYISICKHPHFFIKTALFYSSVSDLIAYATNKISFKICQGIPEKKILDEYVLMLRLIKRIFTNYTGLVEIRDLIEKV